ncbi:MAG: hypothetical protein LBI99_05495 [Propionibacteriaceae bacterium]|nr:hypothetical protein [Propionibacteriaceae bacterium]
MAEGRWRVVLSPEVRRWHDTLTGMDAAIAHAAISKAGGGRQQLAYATQQATGQRLVRA